MKVAFLHPDLGIGGAERLVIDAALHLQAAGHEVVLFTSHLDPTRCFPEVRDGALEVRVHGSLLRLGHRLRAPGAILRGVVTATAMSLGREQFDVVFCDVVAHAIPLVRLLSRAGVIFYCHFPDKLLAPRRTRWYQLYRLPIDRLEELGMRRAHRVLVNSQFTAVALRHAFPRLRDIRPEVLYPGVDPLPMSGDVAPLPMTFLCIHRFEPKKNVRLAIEALAELRRRLTAEEFAGVTLLVTGGYDERLRENVETLASLRSLAAELGLGERVRFLPSVEEEERRRLLAGCLGVIYTPENEHFGLVPLEAMAAGKPVIAANTGGPTETVQDQITGFLCAAAPFAFAAAMERLLREPGLAAQLGTEGRRHALSSFSRQAFGERLEAIVEDVSRRRATPGHAAAVSASAGDDEPGRPVA